MNVLNMKVIKNEQWYAKDLVAHVMCGKVIKIKSQRKKKWLILPNPKNPNCPNEKDYILFLYKTKNSVHAVMFGSTNGQYKNIDGNNRINAICHFLTRPFDIFPEYLDELFFFLDGHVLNKDGNACTKDVFKSMTYNQIMIFRYNKFFIENKMKDLYNTYLKSLRDEMEPIIEKIQTQLKINGEDNFDTNALFCVNLFENYTDDELNEMYLDVNQFNNKMDEIDLLASRLFNVTDFHINDILVLTSIKSYLVDFYKQKAENEVLQCYQYTMEEQMNAYDFMVGFQSYLHSISPLIEEVDSNGVSLLFKIYKTLYKGLSFSSENVNDFIGKMLHVSTILKEVNQNIFLEKLTGLGKIFDSCNKKMTSLEKNNIYILAVAIIGWANAGHNNKYIVNMLERAILYHFFVQDIDCKETRDEYRLNDRIAYEAGGKYIDNQADKIYKNPEYLVEQITEANMRKVLNILMTEHIIEHERFLPNGKNKNNKRRSRKFFEKMLMVFYYRSSVPASLLNNTFWVEHISPFSSTWEGEIDIERLGNIVPIIDTINNLRGTKHIDEYNIIESKEKVDFIKYIAMIPSVELYNTFMSHDERKPTIIDNEEYNEMCISNEQKYIDNFLNEVFPQSSS